MKRIAGAVALLLGIAVGTVAAAQPAQDASDNPAHQAVWKIIDTKRRNQATAVAVGAKHALTNAHVLYEFVRKDSTSLVLTRARGQETVDIVGPIAISATYDLALLETAQSMPRHLRIARTVPLGRADQLHMVGYPKERFATLRATQEMNSVTRASYRLPMERMVEAGFSGGAVLAPNDDIVGIQKTSTANMAGVIPPGTVREFLAGVIGVRCDNRTLAPCLEKAIGHTRTLAKEGNADAQYQLGRSDRYIPGARELDLLERAARRGNPTAQSELAGVYDEGAPGYPKDLKKAAYWSEEAAKQGDETEQRITAIYYFNGEGVPRDIDKANAWLDRAVKSGLADAEYDLGITYRYGEGVPKDLALARYWFGQAAARGDTEAAEALAEMGEPDTY